MSIITPNSLWIGKRIYYDYNDIPYRKVAVQSVEEKAVTVTTEYPVRILRFYKPEFITLFNKMEI